MAYTVVNISGGKDSVAMCIRLLEEHQEVDEIIFADTGMEYPECYDAIKKLEHDYGVIVTRLKPEHSFEYYAAHIEKVKPSKHRLKGYGFPSFCRRWCTTLLKQKLINGYCKEFSEQIGDVVNCIGIAADETKRIRNRPGVRYPLVEWGMTESDCLAYCRERGFFLEGESPYDHIDRMSCFCCPLSNLKQVEYLIKHRPELWERIKYLEDAIGEPWKRGTAYYEEAMKEVE